MRLSTNKDLQCKYCVFTKSKLDLYCYFAFDEYWSDLRHLAPDMATEIPSEGITRDLIDRVVSFAKQNDFKPFPIELEGTFYCT